MHPTHVPATGNSPGHKTGQWDRVERDRQTPSGSCPLHPQDTACWLDPSFQELKPTACSEGQ